MNRKLLLEKYIKVAVRKALQEEEQRQKKATRAMYLVYRFPGLKDLMENLMSPAFARFVTNVSIIAPKPTTFMIEMINGEDFNIRYDGRKNFTVKVAGRKYNVQNLGELERAQQAIANVLELDYAVDEKDGGAGEAAKPDAGAEAFSAATNAPAAEIPAEIPPTGPEEETPAPEEETPPAEA
jgi:hypothetical protein